jgi:trimethylamine--corrinoid protein Co-methyltransferase
MASLTMSDMLLGVGLLNGGMVWSFEQMIMDCEIFDIVHKMMEGIAVNEETIALDAIREAGPCGNYLTLRHTREHARKLFLSTLMDRRPYSEWQAKKNGARDWAREKAKNILHSHEPEPLDEKLSAELSGMIKTIETSKK